MSSGAGSTASLSTASLIAAGAGDVISILGAIDAGNKAQMASVTNAGTIAQISELNAQLIEQGGELNAGVEDFNAAALEGQATDAITRGQEAETQFRQQIKGLIGSQRASFAAQGVDVSAGSALDVQKDTAYQGELDALTMRTNAAREAWGYTVAAQGETLQANATLTLAGLQSANTIQVGLANAANARLGGTYAAAAANWGAASSILTDTATLLKASGH